MWMLVGPINRTVTLAGSPIGAAVKHLETKSKLIAYKNERVLNTIIYSVKFTFFSRGFICRSLSKKKNQFYVVYCCK